MVSSLLQAKGRDVLTTTADRSLADAVATLAEKRIGALIVVGEAGEVAGIISERDVVRALARGGASALADPVRAHMTAKVTTCLESTHVRDIMELMTAGKFRHVPVLEDGRLVGVVSIGDVVKARLNEAETEAEEMRNYIHAA